MRNSSRVACTLHGLLGIKQAEPRGFTAFFFKTFVYSWFRGSLSIADSFKILSQPAIGWGMYMQEDLRGSKEGSDSLLKEKAGISYILYKYLRGKAVQLCQMYLLNVRKGKYNGIWSSYVILTSTASGCYSQSIIVLLRSFQKAGEGSTSILIEMQIWQKESLTTRFASEAK